MIRQIRTSPAMLTNWFSTLRLAGPIAHQLGRADADRLTDVCGSLLEDRQVGGMRCQHIELIRLTGIGHGRPDRWRLEVR